MAQYGSDNWKAILIKLIVILTTMKYVNSLHGKKILDILWTSPSSQDFHFQKPKKWFKKPLWGCTTSWTGRRGCTGCTGCAGCTGCTGSVTWGLRRSWNTNRNILVKWQWLDSNLGPSGQESDTLTTRLWRPEVITTAKFGYLRNSLRRTMIYPHNMHIFGKLLTCRLLSAMFHGCYPNPVGVAVK